MAVTIKGSSEQKTFPIEKWYGLNEAPDGDTKLRLGDAAVCRNWKITQDGNLQRRPGNSMIKGLLQGYKLHIDHNPIVVRTDRGASSKLTLYPEIYASYDGFPTVTGTPVQVTHETFSEYAGWYWRMGTYFTYQITSCFYVSETNEYIWRGYPVTCEPDTENTDYAVRGMWSGELVGKEYVLAVCNGKLWNIFNSDTQEWVKEEIGDIEYSGRVTFFPFDGKVYILTGTEYYEFDGTFYKPVQGYRPLISISNVPSGGGQLLEEINKLNGMRRLWFSPDGKSSSFKLPERDLISIDYVMFNDDGSYMSPSLYSTNALDGTVTFGTSEEFTGDGETTEFELTTENVVSVRAFIDGTELTADYRFGDYKVAFSEAPEAGSKITIEEVTLKEATENFGGDDTTREFVLKKADIDSVVKVVIDGVELPEGTGFRIIETVDDKTENREGDGSTKNFVLKNSVSDIKKVTVDGAEKTKDTDWTFNAETNTLTFTTAPGDDKAIVVTEKTNNQLSFLVPPENGANIIVEEKYRNTVDENFTGNGSNRRFTIATADNLGISKVTVDGTEKVKDTDWTYDKDTKILKFTTAPANNKPIVVKVYVKGDKTETLTGDGTKTDFKIDIEMLSITKVTVNGITIPQDHGYIVKTDEDGKLKVVLAQIPIVGMSLTVTESLKVRQTEIFEGDGKKKDFDLMNPTTTEVTVSVDGELKTDNAGFTFDKETNKVVFDEAPEDESIIKLIEDTALPEGVNTIEIGYTAAATFRQQVCHMRFAELFLGATDNAVFLYGDGSNEAFYSSIDYDGNPRADYFPDLNEIAIGDTNTPVTGLIRHQSRLIAFKTDSTWSISYGTITLEDGNMEYGFYVSTVNRTLGNSAPGMVQLIQNDPWTLHGKQLYQWKSNSYYSSNISADERTARRISDKIYATLGSYDSSKAYTFDDNDNQEFYICYDKQALVCNYQQGAWYQYTDFDAVSMCKFANYLIFGTSDGKTECLSYKYKASDGLPIDSYWESGSMDFGRPYQRKYSAELWVGLKPESSGNVIVTVQTDKKSEYTEKTVGSDLFSFSHMNFGRFSFKTNRKPQVSKLKIKAKKFVFYKLIFKTNEADTAATVLTADIRVRFTGDAK